MLDFGFYNLDCMEGMKEFPDNYFDLAIVDPPYGINIGSTVGGGGTLAERKMIVGGGNISTPKHTRRSTTVPRRTPHILPNWNELQSEGSYGGELLP